MNSADMTTPVTRGELQEELSALEGKLEIKLSALEAKIEAKIDAKLSALEGKLETNFDRKLEIWGGALLARIQDSERRLSAELTGHVKAIQESMQSQFAALDDKYGDLPGRVRRLEDTVFSSAGR